ncbi:MAG: T9SS type A sorting domain-containing protein [Flavobacteriales bacterium]|nr:T9SS type A sorting domain-containing protein [Flavobacteriales bacterium]
MKKLLILALVCFASVRLSAQITITAADMPVADDTLYYSTANPIGSGFNAGDSGASAIWDFSTLSKIISGTDTYQKAAKVNILYAALIGPTAYGYKIGDSIPGIGAMLPISINDIYNFYNKKNAPSRFITEGFAAKIAGVPTPLQYADEDEIYYFPLQYGDSSKSTFLLNIPIPTIGTLRMKGTRTTKVDGWGTITTPYFTTPVNCIRVRSEIDEIDSFITNFIKTGIPRKTVEYKYLVKGEHFPAVWVTANIIGNTETVSSIRFKDSMPSQPVDTTGNGHNTGLNVNPYSNLNLNIYPNPADKEMVTIDIPQNWNEYVVSVYDAQGRLVLTQQNSNHVDLRTLQSGYFIVQIISNSGFGYGTVLNQGE